MKKFILILIILLFPGIAHSLSSREQWLNRYQPPTYQATQNLQGSMGINPSVGTFVWQGLQQQYSSSQQIRRSPSYQNASGNVTFDHPAMNRLFPWLMSIWNWPF